MKVLWVVNVILPQIERISDFKASHYGGWLVSLCDDLLQIDNLQLVVCCPYTSRILTMGNKDNLTYYCFSNISNKQISQFEEILINEKPDIIQIFGTESIHTLNMVNVCLKLLLINKVVIHIQGLISVCSKHFAAFLPTIVINSFTIRDIVKFNNIKMSQLKMKNEGFYEIESISKVKHVVGRTDWDRACIWQINNSLKYHYCNESLRNEFYKYVWEYDNCEKHSIFLSQASYPIKGFHLMLEAMPLILKEFPDARIYTTGKDLFNLSFKEKMKSTYYQKYLKYLIKKYKLESNVEFVGILNENQMVERYLKSNVFVSASSIENSPNSVGEAMLLGVPTISSDVGGVKNLLVHNSEGFIYQADAPYMLSHYVCEIFRNLDLAKEFSMNARFHALKTHDRSNNIKNLLEIYKIIQKEQE